MTSYSQTVRPGNAGFDSTNIEDSIANNLNSSADDLRDLYLTMTNDSADTTGDDRINALLTKNNQESSVMEIKINPENNIIESINNFNEQLSTEPTNLKNSLGSTANTSEYIPSTATMPGTPDTPSTITVTSTTTMPHTTTISSTTPDDNFIEKTQSDATPKNDDPEISTKVKTERGTLDDFLNSLDGHEDGQQQLLDFVQSSGVQGDIGNEESSHIFKMMDVIIDETNLFASTSKKKQKFFNISKHIAVDEEMFGIVNEKSKTVSDFERKAAKKFMLYCNRSILAKNSPSDSDVKNSMSARKSLSQKRSLDATENTDSPPKRTLRSSKQNQSCGTVEVKIKIETEEPVKLQSNKKFKRPGYTRGKGGRFVKVTQTSTMNVSESVDTADNFQINKRKSEAVDNEKDPEMNSEIIAFYMSERKKLKWLKTKKGQKHREKQVKQQKKGIISKHEQKDDNPLYYASTDSESEIPDNSMIKSKSHGNFSGNNVADGGRVPDKSGDIPVRNDNSCQSIAGGITMNDTHASGKLPESENSGTITSPNKLSGTGSEKFTPSKDLEASNEITSDFDSVLQNFQENTRVQSRKVVAIPLDMDTRENSQEKSCITKKLCKERGRFKCKVCKKTFADKKSASRHFVSGRHMRKTLNHPNRIDMLEKNHSYMLYLSPFQCQVCRFYCNSAADIKYHLESIDHITMTESLGVITCAGCNFLCDNNAKIVEHITEPKHRDNHQLSKAVIIKHLKYDIKCKFCERRGSLEKIKRHIQQSHVSLILSKSQTALTKTPSQCNVATDKHGNYLCNMCEYSTKYSRSFIKHYRTYHGEKPFYCNPCGLSFTNANTYNVHKATLRHLRMDKANTNITLTERKDDEELLFECMECPEKFRNDSLLLIHKRLKHPSKDKIIENHECDTCGKKFEDEKKLKFHKYTHTHLIMGTDIGRFYNGTDEVSIKFRDFLNEIESKIHTDLVSCPECKLCICKRAVPDHLRTHVDQMIFVCPICSKGYKHPSGLHTHLENHLGITKTCPTCGQEVASRNYKDHLRYHSGKDEPQICHICSKQYALRGDLLRHIRLYHSGSGSGRKFICEWPNCGSQFPSKFEMQHHAYIHTGQKRFACEHCDYRSCRKKTLMLHMEVQHLKTKEERRTHLCTHCGYRAPSDKHLKLHVRIHTNTRPYQCPYCPLRTNALDNLRKHIMNSGKHRGLKVYQCKFCEFGTNACTDFKSHILRTHSDKVDTNKRIVYTELAGIFYRPAIEVRNMNSHEVTW